MSDSSVKFYNNNSNLKSAGQQLAYTEDQIKEYLKCAEDPVYFISNYCQIVTLDHGLQPFKLYDCQVNKIKVIHENRKVILMEGRQQGKTTTSAAYILWYTLFQSSKTVAILANKATAAREVLDRYQTMFECLPKWLQQGVTTWNKGDIELENGSKVFTAATSASGIRGKSVNLLYVDEAAIIPNTVAEQFFTSVYPTISAGQTTKILLSSTPLGYNHFWKFWNEAEQDKNGFVPLFIPYWEIPGRDEVWAEEQRKILGELKFNQEVLCNFLGSSLTLVAADTIAKMSPRIPYFTSQDGLDLYEKPQEDHVYAITVDPAKGVGGDYSALVIFDITQVPYKIVGKYRNKNMPPMLFPTVIAKIGKDFNNAHVLIELNAGEQVADILYNDLEYENILMVSRTPRGQEVSSGFGGSKLQFGVYTDKKTKRQGCFNLKALVENQRLLVQDADIISEISTFIETNGTYAADEGYHDDLVMCLVLFGWVSNSNYFEDLSNINIRQAIYENHMKAIEEQMTPFGFYNDGRDASEEVAIRQLLSS